MKKLLLVFISLVTISFANSQPKVLFEELASVNKEWLKHQACDSYYLTQTGNLTETEKIQLHLKEVEKILRGRDVSHFSEDEQLARQQNLDFLNEYWKRSKFPKNYYHNYRIPYFIDPEGTACAVGYLIIRSGHEELAATISEQTNFAYLAEMEYAELGDWAASSGLTFEELAWIQPGYPPPAYLFNSLGGGTNGTVHEIIAAPAGDVVYVAGEFSQVDGNITVQNIAEWRNGIAGFSWYPMNGGVNGPVHAMIEFNGNLYVGGKFTMAGNQPVNNIARWDGSQWHAVSFLPDVVYDLTIHNNELIAGGAFASIGALGISRVARLNGNNWVNIGDNFINDTIFALLSASDTLYAAGKFTGTEMGPAMHIAKLNGNFWTSVGNGVSTTARALTVHNDTIYVGGDIRADMSVERGLWKWNGLDWVNIPLYVTATDNKPMIFDMESHQGNLLISGKFDYLPLTGTIARNIAKISAYGEVVSIGIFDSTVHAIVPFNNTLYIGGSFDKINYGGNFNGIVSTDLTTGIKQIAEQGKLVSIYPNPFRDLATIKVSHIKEGQEIRIMDLSGKMVLRIKDIKESNVISGAELAVGTYFYQLVEENKVIEKGKIVIQ